MATPPESALAECLRAAERAAVVAFVAGLSEARGAPVVSRTERGVVLAAADDERRVVVHRDGDAPAPTADVVVSLGATPPATDAQVVTVADLHRQLCYAIDRERAERLVRTHLDCEFASLVAADGTDEGPPSSHEADTSDTEPGPRPATAEDTAEPTGSAALGDDVDDAARQSDPDDGGRIGALVTDDSDADPSASGAGAVQSSDSGDGGSGGRSRSAVGVDLGTAALGLLALVVVAATVAAGPGVPLGSALLGTVGGGGDAGAAGSGDSQPRFMRDEIEVDPGSLPPGVEPTGEMDERRLAEATTAQLHNESYRLTLVYREFVDGEPTGVYAEIIRVEDGRTYRADVRRAGTLVQTPPTIAESDRYANGTVSLRHENNETTVTSGALSPSDPFQDELAQYLRWYLSVEHSRITDRTGTGAGTTYRISTNGDSYVGVTNSTGSALITRDGLVWSVHRQYDDPYHSGVHAVVTLRITGVGSTTAPKPGWAE